MRAVLFTLPGATGLQDLRRATHHLGWELLEASPAAESPDPADLILVPGGAALTEACPLSLLAQPLARHIQAGGRVLAVAEGVGVLCALGHLPGRWVPEGPFHHRLTHVRVERTDVPATRHLRPGAVLTLQVAQSGHYQLEPEERLELELEGGVLLRVCDPDGGIKPDARAPGDMAAILVGGVLGIFPRLERDSGGPGLELLRGHGSGQ